MDNHLRILLRRYATTQSPEDAELVAKALLRSTDISNIDIWVYELMYGTGAIEEVELFTTMKDAFSYAASWFSEYLNGHGDRLSEEALQILKFQINSLEAENNFEKANELLTELSNSVGSSDYRISVYSLRLN